MSIEKQDSNNVGLFVSREASNRTLAENPVFVTREPNSFEDLGGEYTKVARRPFNPSRQRKKGGLVDLDADGGWNEDVTQNNMLDVIDAALFAAPRRKGRSTNVAATAATDDYTVDSSADFLAGHIVLGSGFAESANNGIHVVNGITDGTHVSTGDALVDEAASAAQTLEVVGYQFPLGDMVASLVTGGFRLTSAAIDCSTLSLIPGEYCFIGGQAAGNRLGAGAALTGYARVKEADADGITFDKTTFAAAADDGADTTLQIFFGTVIRNEDDPDDIVKYTHTVERTLGRDEDGRQSENIDGFVYNELTWHSPLSDKVNVDIKGIGASHNTRTGAEGPLSETEDGVSIVAALGEDFFNTSSNVYRIRMAKLDPATLNPTPMFARVSEFSVAINNNVSGNKAQGVLGSFDTTAGGFDVDLECTAYFSHVSGVRSIRENEDVTFDAIYSKQNAAIVLDLPLLANGGGRLEVEQDQPIMLPLESPAAESPFGHTVLFNFLPYVPDVGMATGAA
jgi:hypothetical protein